MARKTKKTNRRQHGESSIYQRKDGRWVCEIHLGYRPDGRPDRRYLYGDSPDEVQKKRDEFKTSLAAGFTPPKGKGDTVAEWLTYWLHTIAKRRVRESTWNDSYRPKVEGHMIPRLGKEPLKDLDDEQVENFYEHLRTAKARGGAQLAESHILQIHRILSNALKEAVRRKKMQRNPCDFVTPPSPDRVEPMPPDREEAAQILAAVAGRRNGARWTLNLTNGPRQGEALGLLWPMVDLTDLDHATIRITWELARAPWRHGCEDAHACGARRHRFPCPPVRADCPKVRPSGRPHVCVQRCPSGCKEHGGRCPSFCDPACTGHASTCPQRAGGGLRLVEPKSAKSKRTMTIPRQLAEQLAEHRAAQRAERENNATWTGWAHACERRPKARELVCPDCRMPTRKDLLVFTQVDGSPIDARRDWQEWADLLVELGLPHYRVHDGRHFSATTQLEEGVDPRVVQENHGHATSSFTQDFYQHVTTRLQRDAAEKIGNALFK
jgi:integrase